MTEQAIGAKTHEMGAMPDLTSAPPAGEGLFTDNPQTDGGGAAREPESQQDSGQSDSARSDSSGQDSSGQDSSVQQDSARDGSQEQDSYQDSSARDSNSQDSNSQDSSGQDSGAQDSSSQDSGDSDSSSSDSSSSASGGPDSGEQSSTDEDSADKEGSTEGGSGSESGTSTSGSGRSSSSSSGKKGGRGDQVVASPEAYKQGSQRLGETGDNLSKQVQKFLSEVRDPGVLGKTDVIGRFGNPMYGVAVGWVGKCLEELSGAYGDHSEALKDSGRGYEANEATNKQTISKIPTTSSANDSRSASTSMPEKTRGGSDSGTSDGLHPEEIDDSTDSPRAGTSTASVSAPEGTDLGGRGGVGGGLGGPGASGAERTPGGPSLVGNHTGAGEGAARLASPGGAPLGGGGSPAGQGGQGTGMGPMAPMGRGQDRRGSSDMQAGQHLDEEDEERNDSVWDALLVQGGDDQQNANGARR